MHRRDAGWAKGTSDMRLVKLHTQLVGSILVVLPICLLGAAPPSSTTKSADFEPDQTALLEELEEVIVSGQQPAKTARQLINWLASIAGKFTFEGHVDLRGRGNTEDLRPVQGSANCIAFGEAPGVKCELTLTWPGSPVPDEGLIPRAITTLNPGIILYGIDPRRNGIRYMMVGNKGDGEGAVGLLFNNTLIATSPCANDRSSCERRFRVTVEPDIQVIRMQIDTHKDHGKVLGLDIQMRRILGSKPDVFLGLPK
jgi:hypothetical protein